MAAPETIELRAPNEKKITGALKRTGEVCPVTCRFARLHGDPNFFYEFASGDLRDVPSNDVELRLVDEDGERWTRSEVEWASMPPVR